MNRTSVQNAVTNLLTPDEHDQWRLDAVDEHLVSLLDPTSIEADQYRTLRHVIERKQGTKKLIAVTSAVAGDGKTTTSLNLAGALAHAPNTRVLIWDVDLRTPSLGNRLGLTTQSPGLVDLILDPGLTLDDVVRQYPRFNLSVLPVGQPLTVPYELLKSPRFGELLHQASQQYDHIVLDTPPLVPVPDALLIADHVDGFVMVVTAHRTPRKLLEDALNRMDPAKIIGIVFNRDDRPFSGYYGYHYGYYGFSHSGGRRAGGQPRSGRWRSVLEKALHALVG
jgi:polysaccharide biosynthesis transport protein